MRPRILPPLASFLLFAGCGGLESGAVAPADIPDPTTVARTGHANDWLICPQSMCTAKPSAMAASYVAPPAEQYAVWRAVLAAQPRVTPIAEDPSRGLLLVQDRTPLLRFVDTISIRVLPGADGGSTFAAYSKSNIGRYDFGTNRRRLERWVAAVTARLTTQP